MKGDRKEYGDWQTNQHLSEKVCTLLKEEGCQPDIIFEPTCGKGSFIWAALNTFDSITDVYTVEIYKPYIDSVKEKSSAYPHIRFHLFHESIFDFDMQVIPKDKNILLIGNPPWVTNSDLSDMGSNNLPQKSNYKRTSGLQAITGKGNFDIAESIVADMLKAFSNCDHCYMAMLIKNSVIKNIVEEQRNTKYAIKEIKQYNFDSLKEFDAATNASLFMAVIGSPSSKHCDVYNLYDGLIQKRYGFINNKFVSDFDKYQATQQIDHESCLTWWSGIKHDCSKVMELKKTNGCYYNGFKQQIEVEDKYIYPFLKSSDLKGGCISTTDRYLLVTQRHTSDETNPIKEQTPQTYQYLMEYAHLLDNRKSSIYKNRPRFCIFGVGDYSFCKYKIAISALYKEVRFTLIESEDKPIVFDDTIYMMGFECKEFAYITYKILNSKLVLDFIESVSFSDAKRVINKDLLMRIDLYQCAHLLSNKMIGVTPELYSLYIQFLSDRRSNKQLSLF